MGDLDCVQGALDKLDRAGMPCPCSVSCEQEEFDKTVTVASWPSDLYWVRHVSLDLRRGGADGLLKICQASSKSLFRPYIFSCIKNNRYFLLRLSEEPGSLPGLHRRPDEDVPGQVPEPHHQQPRPGQRLLQHQGGAHHHAGGKVLGTGVNCNTYISNENEEKTRIFFSSQVNTLVSSLGGAMSLYLGMAVVMLFEVLELAADVAGILWGHFGGGGSFKKDKKFKASKVSLIHN